MKNIDLSRSTLDEMGTWWVLQKIATGKIGDVSPKPSDKIGEMVVKDTNGLAYLGMPADRSYLGICIVLTMDMDFCHIDGYEGLSIYFHDTDPKSKHKGERYYLKRKTGTQPRSECKRVYLDWREDWPLDAEEKNRQIRELEADTKMPEQQKKARIADLEKERHRTLWDLAKREYEEKHPYRPPYDPSGMGTMYYLEAYQKERDAYCQAQVSKIEAEMAKTDFATSDDLTLDKFLKDMNTSLFETWKQQVMRTERITVAEPLRLSPEGTIFELAVELLITIDMTAMPVGAALDDVEVLRAPQGTNVYTALPTRPAGPNETNVRPPGSSCVLPPVSDIAAGVGTYDPTVRVVRGTAS